MTRNSFGLTFFIFDHERQLVKELKVSIVGKLHQHQVRYHTVYSIALTMNGTMHQASVINSWDSFLLALRYDMHAGFSLRTVVIVITEGISWVIKLTEWPLHQVVARLSACIVVYLWRVQIPLSGGICNKAWTLYIVWKSYNGIKLHFKANIRFAFDYV